MLDLTDLHVYRTFWPRLWAGLIDFALFMPLVPLNIWIWRATSTPALLVPWFVFATVSGVAYSIVLHAYRGQTLGKWLMGIRVLDISGSKLSAKQAVLRDSVWLVLILYDLVITLPLVAAGQDPYSNAAEFPSDLSVHERITLYGGAVWFLLELGTMLLNRKRRAVHDFIAGSVVVRLRGAMAVTARSSAGA